MPFCKNNTSMGLCYISLFKFKSFDKFNTSQITLNFRHLLSCDTIAVTGVRHEADDACSIQSTWSCYWLDQFLTLAFNTWISLKSSMFHWICPLPGDFVTKVKQINSQSDLILMSSFAGPSYLTIRSSVYIF